MASKSGVKYLTQIVAVDMLGCCHCHRCDFVPNRQTTLLFTVALFDRFILHVVVPVGVFFSLLFFRRLTICTISMIATTTSYTIQWLTSLIVIIIYTTYAKMCNVNAKQEETRKVLHKLSEHEFYRVSETG